MFSDEVQIVSPRVEPENWHLVTPFFDFDALRFWKHLHVVGHARRSYLGPDAFPAAFQLFHELADQLRWVFFTDVCGLTIEGVPNANRNWYVCVLDCEHACWLFPLILITVHFEVAQDCVWVALRLGPWQLHIYFPYFTRPCLDYVVASSSEHFCAFYSCFEPVFSCLVIVSNDFITIVWVTFSASVPVTAVVLFWVHIRQQGHAQPIARRCARMPRGECEFSAVPLLVRASKEILKKMYVLKRRPSRKLSAVLRLFRPGIRSPSSLGRTFRYAIEGCNITVNKYASLYCCPRLPWTVLALCPPH